MTTALVTGASSGIGVVYARRLPHAATATHRDLRTSWWRVPNVMEVEDLVDAALVGFDRKELVTIPPVPDVRPVVSLPCRSAPSPLKPYRPLPLESGRALGDRCGSPQPIGFAQLFEDSDEPHRASGSEAISKNRFHWNGAKYLGADRDGLRIPR